MAVTLMNEKGMQMLTEDHCLERTPLGTSLSAPVPQDPNLAILSAGNLDF